MSSLPVDRAACRPAGADSLAAALDRTLIGVERFGLGASAGARWLADLRQRLRQQRLQIAVLGQFKRGKSTFLNALLTDDVLPTAVVPLTAVPVFIEHGSSPSLRATFADGREEEYRTEEGDDLRAQLHRLATEDGNSGNRLGVERIRLFHPAALLRAGIVLIDTPGVGSTLQHNTQATLDFLSECDAALFVVSPDPPITQAEIDFLSAIRDHVARLVFVLNKIDYLEDGDREAAVGFLRRVLAQQASFGPKTPLFCISARQALRGAERGDERLLTGSGLAAVTEYLTEVVAPQKAMLLQAALSRKAGQALDALLMQSQLELRSLTLPLDDLERRLGEFDRALREIERERVAAQDLLTGEKSRARELLETDCREIRSRATELLRSEIDAAFAGGADDDPAPRAQTAIGAAIRGFFPDQLATVSGLWEQRLAEFLAPYRRRANELIEAVRRAAADLFDVPCASGGVLDAFEAARRPYWVTGEFSVTLDSAPQTVTDRWLPSAARRARQRRRSIEQAETLVRRNAENLRWATLQNLNEAFRRFGAQLDRDLAEAIQATYGAIHAASQRRRDSSQSLTAEIGRLNQAVEELAAARQAVGKLACNVLEPGATDRVMPDGALGAA